jgi:hypothetical protein
MDRQQISLLISVCYRNDAQTFGETSKLIVKNIQAMRYEVVVPDQDVPLFQQISAKPFVVVAESFYLQGKNLAWLRSRIPADKQWRAGWYLQQFIKIAAAKNANADDIVLIWDSDTAPLKPLAFINTNGKLIYYKGSEHHAPYFTVIKNLLGLEKSVDFSFIAQCFVIKARWARDFCDLIEQKNKHPWMEAIISCVDFNEDSGFSEYESLGTYITHYHRDEIAFSKNQWCRCGNSLIGGIKKLSLLRRLLLSNEYDFISFEAWDKNRGAPRLFNRAAKLARDLGFQI